MLNPGEMGRSMSGKEGAAFSEAQWQELERQRNIFKYMMASLPVPSELLSPFSRNHTNNHDGNISSSFTISLSYHVFMLYASDVVGDSDSGERRFTEAGDCFKRKQQHG